MVENKNNTQDIISSLNEDDAPIQKQQGSPITPEKYKNYKEFFATLLDDGEELDLENENKNKSDVAPAL